MVRIFVILSLFLGLLAAQSPGTPLSCSGLMAQGGNAIPMQSPVVVGLGTALGGRKASVEEMAQEVGIEPEKLKGYKRRIGTTFVYRLTSDETLESLAERAARRALAHAQLTPEDLTAIFASSASPTGEFHMPGLARHVGSQLATKEINMTSVSLGCCGGMDAMLLAMERVRSDTLQGRSSTVLVVVADQTTRSLNPEDKASFLLFSEGAAAMVLTNRESSDGYALERGNAVCLEGDISCMRIPNPATNPERPGFYMDGEAVLSFVVEKVVPRAGPLLGWEELPKDALVIPHQGSAIILNQLRSRLEREVYSGALERVGNTTGSSFLFALQHALDSGKLSGDRDLVLLAFGAELKIGAAHLVKRGNGLTMLVPGD